MLTPRNETAILSSRADEFPSPMANVRKFILRKPVGAFSAMILLLMTIAAITAGVVAPYEPTAINVGPQLSSPSASHLMGTDQFGRDVFSRVIHGSRISLWVAIGSTVVGIAAAWLLGTLGAYLGGPVDYFIQRLVDVVQSVPAIIVLIAIIVALEPGMNSVIVALAVRTTFVGSRIARASALSVMAYPYIESARAVGSTGQRVVFRHVFPNIFPAMLVVFSLSVGSSVLAEAALSFLGYGVPPPAPTWGGMLSNEARPYMFTAPWMLLAPALALSLLVFSLNMFGDALRDVVDPRMRGSGK